MKSLYIYLLIINIAFSSQIDNIPPQYVRDKVQHFIQMLTEKPNSFTCNNIVNEIKHESTEVIDAFLNTLSTTPELTKFHNKLKRSINQERSKLSKLPIPSHQLTQNPPYKLNKTSIVWTLLQEIIQQPKSYDSSEFKTIFDLPESNIMEFFQYIEQNSTIINFFNMHPQYLNKFVNFIYNLCHKYKDNITYPVDLLFSINGFKEELKKIILDEIVFQEDPDILHFRIIFDQFNIDVLEDLLSQSIKTFNIAFIKKIPSYYSKDLGNVEKRLQAWLLTLLSDVSQVTDSARLKKLIALFSDYFDYFQEIMPDDFWVQFYNSLNARTLAKNIKASGEEIENQYTDLLKNIQFYLQNNIFKMPIIKEVDYFNQSQKYAQNLKDRLNLTKELRDCPGKSSLSIQQNDSHDNFRRQNHNFIDDNLTQNFKYILEITKFDYASALDFSGISKIPIRKHVNVYVSEVLGVKDIPGLNCLNCQYDETSNDNHGTQVASLIKTIAPNIMLKGGYNNFQDIPQNADIVNFSWGYTENSPDLYQKTSDYLSLDQNKTLMVWASGNSAGSISTDNFLAKKFYDITAQNYTTPIDKKKAIEKKMKNMIWVTSITPYHLVSNFSNIPGEEFQEHTISALGTNVTLINKDTSLTYNSGTSFSAPIVSGVAALLKEEYLEMTPYDIKTCLLESADKEIFPNSDNIPGELLPNGKIRLDPKTYGQGILNAPHALLYAKVLRAKRQLLNNPELEPNSEPVKIAYQEAIKAEERAALESIKKLKWFKKRNKQPTNTERKSTINNFLSQKLR